MRTRSAESLPDLQAVVSRIFALLSVAFSSLAVMALRCLSSSMFGYRVADDTRTDVSVCPRQRACPWENGKAIESRRSIVSN
jgi:hypothetical protein